MEILYYKTLPSTQLFLQQEYKKGAITPPALVYCDKQTQGIGSRGNKWIAKEGNLYMSFLLHVDMLSSDIPRQSLSIYFGYLLYEVLKENGSKVWLKWPNDFYIGKKKIGGMITSIVRDALICGVGLNLVDAPEGFGYLDIELKKKVLIDCFIKKLEKKLSWKQVFRKYSVEFYKNKSYCTHTEKNCRVSLESAVLFEDGSIEVSGERIYSLR